MGDSAFYYCRSLENTALPEGLIRIGNYAFYSTRTTGITLPEGLTRIGEETFYDCTSLTDVLLNKSLTSIGDGAFDRGNDTPFPVVRDSWAVKWCKVNGKDYICLDADEWLNDGSNNIVPLQKSPPQKDICLFCSGLSV